MIRREIKFSAFLFSAPVFPAALIPCDGLPALTTPTGALQGCMQIGLNEEGGRKLVCAPCWRWWRTDEKGGLCDGWMDSLEGEMERCVGRDGGEGVSEGWDSGDTGVMKSHPGGPVRFLSLWQAAGLTSKRGCQSERETARSIHPSPKLKEEHVPCAQSSFLAPDSGSYWFAGLDINLLFVELWKRAVMLE